MPVYPWYFDQLLYNYMSLKVVCVNHLKRRCCLLLRIHPHSSCLCLSVPYCLPSAPVFHSIFLFISLLVTVCEPCTHTLTIHTVVSVYLCLPSISNSLWYPLYSSCLTHPGKLHFVFNVVELPACSGRPAGRRGLCTGWLFDLINPVLLFPGKDESSGRTALPKVMSTLEYGELKLDCANLWTLGYISTYQPGPGNISAEYKCSGAVTVLTPNWKAVKYTRLDRNFAPLHFATPFSSLSLFCLKKKKKNANRAELPFLLQNTAAQDVLE